MKKLTDFIVKERYLFLTLFVVLALISLYLGTKVNINEDIMKYLPKTSETKIGKDIMDKEFSQMDSSTLNVMFKDLSNSEKNKILESLEEINGVSSVNYEETEEYNKGKYTLYVLNVDDYANSKTATQVYNEVKDNYKTAGMSGTIYDENKPILQLWIVFLAIGCAMVILIILSDSFIEPWLYLISIGIAVFINKGTNIMFSSVSSITNSIVAILQLALSMDYSIMLSNRFKQEKKTHKNKIKAMEEALYQSFKAILSSSVTTIVGLLALVFMSFTIGRDLGFVLAKGVLLSLISIFFCLPALLLIFDNLISKTSKKAPKLNLDKLGGFIYKTRYVQTVLIVGLFIGAYFLKGNINILYTGSEQDKVGAIFPATNQIAIVYNNKYEEIMSEYCNNLENDEKIDQVLCYSNTINQKLAYNELNNKFQELGQDTEIEEELIKIIYYHYYNKNEDNKMTLEEFISFIKGNVYNNSKFSESLSQDIKNNIDLLENFTSVSLVNNERTIEEIANILGMEKSDALNILIYYNSKNKENKMTIKEFVDFMLSDIANDPVYSSSLDNETIQKLKQLQYFTNKNIINEKMDAKNLASVFGMDTKEVEELLLFYRTNLESNTKMTLNEFASFALEIASKEEYKDMKDMFTKDNINSLKILETLSTKNNIETDLDFNTMKNMLQSIEFNIEDNTLMLLYTYYIGYNSQTKLSIKEFADTVLEMYEIEEYKPYFSSEEYKPYFSSEIINNLSIISKYKEVLPKETVYEMFGITNPTIQSLFNGVITKDNISPFEFVNTSLSELNLEVLPKEQRASFEYLQNIFNDIEAGNKYSVTEISTKLKQNNTITSVVYGVYDLKVSGLKNISIKNLINFIYMNKDNDLVSSKLGSVSSELEFAYMIVNNIDTKYSYKEISNIISVSSEQANKIFDVYDFYNNETKLTLLEFVTMILDNKDNELLKGKISNSVISELSLVKEVMISTLNDIKYLPSSLSSLLNIDSDTMGLLFSLYDYKYINSNQKISLKDYVSFIVNDVMNNQEYSSNFDNDKRIKITTISKIINDTLSSSKYTSDMTFDLLSKLSDGLNKSLIDLVYMYYGSIKEYDLNYSMTIEEVVNYLNNDIIKDNRFDDFIDTEKRKEIIDAKNTVMKSKDLLVSDKYSRAVLNTKYNFEDKESYDFVNKLQSDVGNNEEVYIVGNTPMAVQLSKTFDNELNRITLLTMIFIFVVVACTFKDLVIPFFLVLIIQTAVYLTMSIISLMGGSVYFISLLIVQAILMGATIDYAIVYTSYYRESRLTMGIKASIMNAYNKSINTILSSSSILIIVTLVVAGFASHIASKICETISQGTLASVILILFMLPGVLATTDKFICRKGYYKEK